MKLFYKPGACSMAAHILLNEAGTSYQLEKVDTDKGMTESGAAFAATNPRGYVPALKFDDGQVLTENVAILHWIGEQFPDLAPKVAEQPLLRFRQLELLSFLSSELHKAFSPYFSGRPFSKEEQTANLDRLKAKISQFDTLLDQSGPYLLGDTFSVVDAYAFVILELDKFHRRFTGRLAGDPKPMSHVSMHGLPPGKPSRKKDWPHEQSTPGPARGHRKLFRRALSLRYGAAGKSVSSEGCLRHRRRDTSSSPDHGTNMCRSLRHVCHPPLAGSRETTSSTRSSLPGTTPRSPGSGVPWPGSPMSIF